MKVSISWLKDYTPIKLETQALADALTMAGLEVETITDCYNYLDSVLVGQVLEVNQHPNADKLSCCRVDIGDRHLSIVCGAPNVAKDQMVAVALPGTAFPNGMVLKDGVIRGQASEGMLCSGQELGLDTDTSGIMVLKETAALGTPLKKALSLSDFVFEIGLTPNRPDCTSIIGIAREIAAIQKTPMMLPSVTIEKTEGRIFDASSVSIDAPSHCPRYAAKLLEDITVGESPAWLQQRLISVGLRPINNIVDVTNFVMMETGQPLHAFDFDRLAGQRIVVRTAHKGEAFTTLDQKERTLTEEMLLICDGEKPVAIAGVMGGANSEIEKTTSRVLIESAYFNPISVRKTAKRLGLSTDASYRFERGIDPHGTIRALCRAADLMLQVSGGKSISGILDEHPQPSPQRTIPLSVSATNRLLGTDLSKEEMVSLLSGIEIEATSPEDKNDTDLLSFTAPSFRVDLARPEDLMEEIARLHGYNNIPTTLPVMSAESGTSETAVALRETIRGKMIGYGFFEAINYSFISSDACRLLRLPEDDPRQRMTHILNPLTEDQTVMRTTLIPGLLETMERNLSKQEKNLMLFETGKVFMNRSEQELPEETEMLAGLWTGSRTENGWYVKGTSCDFYDIKGIVEALLLSLRIDAACFTKISSSESPYLRPGFAARVIFKETQIGLLGEVHPEALSAYGLKQSAFIFELNLDMVSKFRPELQNVASVSKFPATTRDVTLIIDGNIESYQLLEKVKAADTTLVEQASLFDVFDGKPIPEGKKSISFRITYRSATKTLEDEQVNQLHTKICEQVIKDFRADLP
jgi:phenylalanyl-tRNA synthetase beta chain